jgi:mono/diheme cytochrome c family protein
MTLASTASFATVYRTIGLTLFAIVMVAAVVYVFVNVRFQGKAELGSEIELAANRKPYFDDETLEGPKLERALTMGLLLLFVLAIGIPLYWIREPARQANAAQGFDNAFIDRGAALFAPTGDNLQALNCAGCHGGTAGGIRENYVLTTPNPSFDASKPESDDNVKSNVEVVNWRAPALNTVLLRFSREEVTFILTYGRPGTPMPAWGVAGGGPLNDQQIQNLIDYLESQQLSPDEAQQAASEELDKMMDARFDDGGRVFGSEGEALFNMGLLDNFASGAYSCARCHTADWSHTFPTVTNDPVDGHMIVNREEYDDATANSGCGGSFAPSLCDGAVERQFPAQDDQVAFVTDGSELGIGYGRTGQGDGRMPGFGTRPAEDPLFWINHGDAREPGPGMLNQDQITAIVEYERTLTSTDAQASSSNDDEDNG